MICFTCKRDFPRRKMVVYASRYPKKIYDRQTNCVKCHIQWTKFDDLLNDAANEMAKTLCLSRNEIEECVQGSYSAAKARMNGGLEA